MTLEVSSVEHAARTIADLEGKLAAGNAKMPQALPSVALSGTRPALSLNLRGNFGDQAHKEYSGRMSCPGPPLPTHARLQPVYGGDPNRPARVPSAPDGA
jgi:hypothetical protein